MELLTKAMDEMGWAPEAALFTAAIGAFAVVFLKVMQQTKEYKESPNVQKCFLVAQITCVLATASGAIGLTWYALLIGRKEPISGFEAWVPLIPLVVALVVVGATIWIHRKDGNRTPA